MALVLVADDDPDIRDLLALVLTRAGHDVTVARDGLEAWEELAERDVDLVVLDVNMPRMDGLQVLALCRSTPRTLELPVILLTARAQRHDVEGGLVAGADRYLTKPFSPRAVADVVADLAGRRPSTGPLTADSA